MATSAAYSTTAFSSPVHQRARQLAAGTIAQSKVPATSADDAMSLVAEIYPRLKELVVENAITSILEAFVLQQVKFIRMGFIPSGSELAVMVTLEDDDEVTAMQVFQIISEIRRDFYAYDLYIELTLLEVSDGWPVFTNLSCINYSDLNG